MQIDVRKQNVRLVVRPRGAGWLLFSICCFLFFFFIASAQKSTTKVKNFRVPEYFEPPHETQMKSLLEGAEAEPGEGGVIFITRLKMKTYTETGATEATVQAPHCLFNSKEKTVNSAGPLQLQASGGKLLLEGEGFFWQGDDKNLIISNRVHTTISGALNNSFLP
jgi:hypothetical protein